MSLFLREHMMDDEFVKPIESIMRCGDFKSSFARRLSNRYISKQLPACYSKANETRKKMSLEVVSPVKVVKKLSGSFKTMPSKDNPGPPKSGNQTPKKDSSPMAAENQMLKSDNHKLRWQLSQTESSRQVFITLISQMLEFLYKINNYHFVPSQSSEIPLQNTRFRSILQDIDYGLTSGGKNSKRTYRSTGNLSGFSVTSSRSDLISEVDTDHLFHEEITNIISLTNSLLQTKLPDFSAINSGNNYFQIYNSSVILGNKFQDAFEMELAVVNNNMTIPVINIINENNEIIPDENEAPPANAGANAFNIINYILAISNGPRDFLRVPSPLMTHMQMRAQLRLYLEGDEELNLAAANADNIDQNGQANPLNDDESGFSSLVSYHDLGIPYINIIPPSPNVEEEDEDDENKENVEFIEEDDNNLSNRDPNMNVFWV